MCGHLVSAQFKFWWKKVNVFFDDFCDKFPYRIIINVIIGIDIDTSSFTYVMLMYENTPSSNH